MVANRATTETPASLTYSSFVSRDSARLAFLITELNKLDAMTWDVGNAYLNTPCREKIWFVAGTEHGEKKGKVMVVVWALYGLESSGASWRAMSADTLLAMNFIPTQEYPDVYRRKSRKPYGEEYHQLLLIYVDDVMACSHDPQAIMDDLALTYDLKEGSPTIYLGSEIKKYQVGNGKEHYSVSSTQYFKKIIKTYE